MGKSNFIEVAVGIVAQESKILITQRHPSADHGGCWEFPGGKLEAGESVLKALHRELHEEVGIEVVDAHPLLQVEHDYKKYSVRLHFCFVDRYLGVVSGRERQAWRWVALNELNQYEFPAANQKMIDVLQKSSEQ